jgi:sporulation protein YlmC with PRC-barrel domain
MEARRLWAGLHLLDRQLVDRDGRMAGMVDDLELESGESGQLYVTAILSGPGALANRFARDVFGDWMRWVHAIVSPGERDPARIPFNVVQDIGNHVTLGADRDDVGTASAERWFRDHVVAHIPGSGHASE